MISSALADVILLGSLLACAAAYVWVSKHDGSYLNILTPAFVIAIPAYFFLPAFYVHVFGTESGAYAYVYVYATIAVENVAFAYAYTRPARRLIRLPLHYSYNNFALTSVIFLTLAVLMFVPVLLEFPEYILDPRQIYAHTRTGFGVNFFVSSAMAYLAVILVLFSDRSRKFRWAVVVAAAGILAFHGSKGQVLSLVLFVLLFEVYVNKRKSALWPSLFAALGFGVLGIFLFAATIALSTDPGEALETISSYSDYTRNAMLVINSNFPRQYGRLTFERQTVARIPRVLMPNKPKNFGSFRLADWFYPGAMDADEGAPDFGIGVQYADFGAFAIVYLALFAMLRGWLARIFVTRLDRSRHPADFLLLAFMAGLSVLPVGGAGWMLPEAVAAAMLLRFLSCIGAPRLYREHFKAKPGFPPARNASPVY